MQIKAVIFDYGGVLCFHPSGEQVDELAARCGAPRDRFLQAYWSTRLSYDRGDLEPAQYWTQIGERLGQRYDSAQIADFRRLDIGFWLRLDARMVEWARRVRQAGYRTAVLSNLPPDLGEHLRAKMNLLGDFDCHTFSYEVRAVKPDPAIYIDCARKLGVAPGEALFLDDRPENVHGARDFGMSAVLFESPAGLQEQLERLRASDAMAFSAPPVVLE
jgi:putative hydrolase of the HAD superfamily